MIRVHLHEGMNVDGNLRKGQGHQPIEEKKKKIQKKILFFLGKRYGVSYFSFSSHLVGFFIFCGVHYHLMESIGQVNKNN